MSISFRTARSEDAPIVAHLVDAMDRHYRGDDGVETDRPTRQMIESWMIAKEGTQYLLAFEGEEPIGIACYAVLRPGRDLRGLLFLKDLFVIERLRGRGVGEEMMRALAQLAVLQGIGRIDLTTDRSNQGAQRLYRRLGGVSEEKVMFRFQGETLERLADGGWEVMPDIRH